MPHDPYYNERQRGLESVLNENARSFREQEELYRRMTEPERTRRVAIKLEDQLKKRLGILTAPEMLYLKQLPPETTEEPLVPSTPEIPTSARQIAVKLEDQLRKRLGVRLPPRETATAPVTEQTAIPVPTEQIPPASVPSADWEMQITQGQPQDPLYSYSRHFWGDDGKFDGSHYWDAAGNYLPGAPNTTSAIQNQSGRQDLSLDDLIQKVKFNYPFPADSTEHLRNPVMAARLEAMSKRDIISDALETYAKQGHAAAMIESARIEGAAKIRAAELSAEAQRERNQIEKDIGGREVVKALLGSMMQGIKVTPQMAEAALGLWNKASGGLNREEIKKSLAGASEIPSHPQMESLLELFNEGSPKAEKMFKRLEGLGSSLPAVLPALVDEAQSRGFGLTMPGVSNPILERFVRLAQETAPSYISSGETYAVPGTDLTIHKTPDWWNPMFVVADPSGEIGRTPVVDWTRQGRDVLPTRIGSPTYHAYKKQLEKVGVPVVREMAKRSRVGVQKKKE